MNHHLRRTVVGALAAGTAVTALVVPFADGEATWTPTVRGLTGDPARILPATVSPSRPVSIVSTSLDAAGRPVVTTRTATDRPAAERLIRAGRTAPGAVTVELDAPVRALEVPTGSDPYRASQWDLPKIQAPAAWQRSTGAGIVVAVIDSGVDAGHPDLAGRVLPGLDLVAGTSGVSSDPHGHGTHVAGTIAATTGNGVGVAGFAPDASILPIRTLDANGSGVMSAVATGIVYAADNGAHVINMSLGATAQVGAVTNAIAYARSKGVVVVAAAGNSRASGSPTSYPAADPGVIGVASTDSADNYSFFSNSGGYVDVAAPGSSILSTIPVAKGGYGYKSGTSMAAPHVAAVAALIAAAAPGLGPDEVQQALEGSAVDLGTPGRDADYGYGRIDAAAALAAAAPVTSTPTTPPVAPSTPPAPIVAPTTPPAPTATPPAPTTPPAPPTTAPPTTAPPTTAPTTPAAPTKAPTTPPAPTKPAPTTPPAPTKPTVTPTPKPTTPAPVKVTPVITSDAVSRTVVYGTAVTTTFTVTAGGQPWARRAVQICAADRGAITFTCRSATTTATGTVTVRQSVTAPHRVRLSIPAAPAHHAATSPTYTYLARAVATMEKQGRALYATVNGAAGQTVHLQRLVGGTWTTVATYRAVSRYAVVKPVTGADYRIVVPDTAQVIGAVSTTVRY